MERNTFALKVNKGMKQSFRASLVWMLPMPWGPAFSLLCMFLLLWKFAGAKIFPDCLFVMLVSCAIGFSGKLLILWMAQKIK